MQFYDPESPDILVFDFIGGHPNDSLGKCTCPMTGLLLH